MKTILYVLLPTFFLSLLIIHFSGCSSEPTPQKAPIDKHLGVYELKGTNKYVFNNYGYYTESITPITLDSVAVSKDETWEEPDWRYRLYISQGSPFLKMKIQDESFWAKQISDMGSSATYSASGHFSGDSLYLRYGSSYRGATNSISCAGTKKK